MATFDTGFEGLVIVNLVALVSKLSKINAASWEREELEIYLSSTLGAD